MPTVLEFRTNPAYYAHLKRILDDPIFQTAVAIVKESLRPRLGRASTIEQAGLIGAYSAGGYRTLETLFVLATEAPKQSEEVEEFNGWAGAHLDTPEEIEAAARSQQARNAP